MKQEAFIQFAADSFNIADSKCQVMCSSTASTKNLYTQEFDNKEESTVDDQISKIKRHTETITQK